jgi:cytoskeletal protein CcmA (bactofilin family)
MNKRSIIAAALVLLALPMLAWAGLAHAQRFDSSVDEGETVNSSLYSTGQTVDINGTVNGDVFCAGQTVQINATVNGDVMCAAQTINIRGEVNGDVRLAAQTVTVDASIERNMTVAAQTLSFDADATVGRDATLYGQQANLKGSIGRDVLAHTNETILNGTVGRNVDTTSRTVEVRENAQIEGNLTYTSNNEANIADGAQIAGEVTRETPDEQAADDGNVWGVNLWAYLYFALFALLFALLVSLLFPQAVRKTGDIARSSFGKSLLVGFLAMFAIPIVMFALGVTFIGLPLMLLLLLLWILLMAASGPVVGYFLGKLLFKNMSHVVAITLIGVVLLFVLYFLPYIGFLIALLAYWIGSGAILIALKRHLPKPNYKS